MPRTSRIDAPGAYHHIIVRGIGRRKIFDDDVDRDAFLNRLGTLLDETRTFCYAWALVPNHFHLFLQTGGAPISTAMRRLLTGYAMHYNREVHDRRSRLKAHQGVDLEALARRVSELLNLPVDRVWSKGKYRSFGLLSPFRRRR